MNRAADAIDGPRHTRRRLVVPRASTATLLALLLMAVGGATWGSAVHNHRPRLHRSNNNANDSGHNRLTGAAP